MSLTRRHFAAFLLATTLACVESPMEPGRSHALPAIEPKFVMPPGLTPASFGIVIDTVSILIEQLDSTFCDCTPTVDTVFLNTKIAWPADQESIQIRAEVPEPPPGRVIELELVYSSGGVTMFQGSTFVDFNRGDIRLPPVPMYYNGPGAGADDIQLAPGDTAMAPGDTLDFVATVFLNATTLDTAYISWRVSDSTKARIDHLGRLTLRPGALGSSFLVLGAVPNGAVSTVRVAVPNTVTALQKVSGDSQSSPVGLAAPLPLVVRAVDGSGKPVAGARVNYILVGAAGVTLSDSVVFTDPQGLARVGATPTAIRTDTIRAAVSGTALTRDLLLTGTAGSAAPILFAADSGVGGAYIYRADSLGNNRIIVGYLGGSYGLEWASPRWNAARSRLAYTSYNANSSSFDLYLSTPIGDSIAGLVTDVYASGARFSPTGKIIAFACGNLASDVSGYVCTVNGVDGVMGSLNGVGNGAGRIEVTAAVPGRPNGPAAFAWRPDASTHIAFVRDTANVDPLVEWTSSRFYQTNADGTALTPLSDPVMDLGNGPLSVHGTMDWSPDGSTIVFAATDTGLYYYESSLYLLDVATKGVRKLTTPPLGWTGDVQPHFSPDGQRVLFLRENYSNQMDYFTVRTIGGAASRVTWAGPGWLSTDPYYLGGGWAPDGRSVIVSAPNGVGNNAAYIVPLDTQDQADYLARRRLVGTAGIAGLRDLGVSWRP